MTTFADTAFYQGLDERLVKSGIRLVFETDFEGNGKLWVEHAGERRLIRRNIDTAGDRYCCYCANAYRPGIASFDDKFCSQQCRWNHYD